MCYRGRGFIFFYLVACIIDVFFLFCRFVVIITIATTSFAACCVDFIILFFILLLFFIIIVIALNIFLVILLLIFIVWVRCWLCVLNTAGEQLPKVGLPLLQGDPEVRLARLPHLLQGHGVHVLGLEQVPHERLQLRVRHVHFLGVRVGQVAVLRRRRRRCRRRRFPRRLLLPRGGGRLALLGRSLLKLRVGPRVFLFLFR
mmetsp:Transcript_44807/g.77304  ORF Transcript_44807/g.77304 Transcript_44807/m.77304 type:complete len:201 (-) Transcript_44807:311-913(-)